MLSQKVLSDHALPGQPRSSLYAKAGRGPLRHSGWAVQFVVWAEPASSSEARLWKSFPETARVALESCMLRAICQTDKRFMISLICEM